MTSLASTPMSLIIFSCFVINILSRLAFFTANIIDCDSNVFTNISFVLNMTVSLAILIEWILLNFKNKEDINIALLYTYETRILRLGLLLFSFVMSAQLTMISLYNRFQGDALGWTFMVLAVMILAGVSMVYFKVIKDTQWKRNKSKMS